MSPHSISFRHRADRWLLWGLRGAATISAAVVLLIFGFLAWESLPLLGRVGLGAFLGGATWHPTAGTYGLLPMISASLALTLGSALVTGPLGIASALFLRFYAPPVLAGPYRRILELLAGIPSVVYGFWGLVVLVPSIAALHPPGPSLLAGIAILSLMTLPVVALAADAALSDVPPALLQAGAALGLGRGAIVRRIALPAARSGLVTGVVLQFGRAIGETMAVLMVCGNVVQFPSSFFAPVRALTANIALEMAYATGDHRGALFVTGFLLLVLIAGLALLAEAVRGKTADAR